MPRPLLGAALVLALAAASPAQTTPPPASPGARPTGEAERAAMAKLAFMLGRWDGGGWMDTPRGRQTFHGGEVVQPKLKGTAILVEGDFSGRTGEGAEETPVHTTLGVIAYDARSGTYRFSTWLADGSAGEHELIPRENGWSWELKTPQARIRFTAKFSPAGEWFEIGERHIEGDRWQKFFEMTLRRKS